MAITISLVCALLPLAAATAVDRVSPPITLTGNWTTVFRVGEKGFGCMRFPELHHANNTLYMFVECCESMPFARCMCQ
jgi:hypothetical protein